MLSVAMWDEDGLYWEAEVTESLPMKREKLRSMKNQSWTQSQQLRQPSAQSRLNAPPVTVKSQLT